MMKKKRLITKMIHGMNSLPRLYRKEKTVIRKGEIVRYMTWMDEQGREYDDQYRLVEQGPKEDNELLFLYWCVFIILVVWIIDYCKKKSDGVRGNFSHGAGQCMGSLPHESYTCPFHHHVTTGYTPIAPHSLGVL